MVYLYQQRKLQYSSDNIIHIDSEKELYDLIIEDISINNVIAVDTETEGLFDFKNKVVMLQIGTIKNQYIIDVRDFNLTYILDILNDESILKLLWNVKFDYKFIKKDFSVEIENIYDGFLTELTLQCGFSKQDKKSSLAAAAFKYLNIILKKDERNSFTTIKDKHFSKGQILYGAKDVEILFSIKEKQQELINLYNLQDIINLENEAILALADMEYNGLPFNKDKWTILAKNAEKDLKHYTEILNNYILSYPKLFNKYISGALSLFDDVDVAKVLINWSSPTQVLDVFRTAGIDCDSVGALEIGKFKKEEVLAKIYSDYKATEKLATSFGMDFLKYVNPITDRIHTDYWPILDTHRISSSNPNCQQIPAANKEYLACFECLGDNVIISSDFSG